MAALELAGVAISHPERVVFPDAGYSKGALARYYAAIAPLFLAHAAGRPLSLVRCPQGRARKCFFQKHHAGGFGPGVHPVTIREQSGKDAEYLYLDTAAGILACVQLGTIEFHGWGSHCAALEQPDRLVFDLDPAPEVGFAATARAAGEIRARLAAQGLASFALLSGGKGVHVVVPLRPGHGWAAHVGFAKAFATGLAAEQPERFTASMRKADRGGRIFIDWLRNQRGATAVMPYAVRAREGAPVAAPVSWGELPGIASAHAFTIADSETLQDRAVSGVLAGWGVAEQALPAS